MKRPLRARSGITAYSITSSAIERTPDGMVRPSAFAVLRLITNSNFVGCSTGSEHLVMSALGRRCTYGWPQRCARSALGGIGLEKAASDARKQTKYLITPQHPDWG